MKKPLLSICLRTYNDQKFVEEALKGILMQQVNFDVELVYSDDHSQDKSYEFVASILKGNTQFINIHLLKQDKNLGVTGNLLYTINNANGKYIALCDGDDYWSDPKKLQLQVDFLEANPDFEVCFTNVCTVDENGKITKDKLIKRKRKEYEMKHLPTWAPVSSRIFRNRDLSILTRSKAGEDMYMLLYQSKFGKIRFFNNVLGAYRFQSQAAYSSKSLSYKKDFVLRTHIECMDLVDKPLYPKYQRLILKKIVELRYLDKSLYKLRLKELKNYIQKYPERWSNWSVIKINILFGSWNIIDGLGIKDKERLLLRMIDNFFK